MMESLYKQMCKEVNYFYFFAALCIFLMIILLLIDSLTK